MPPFSRKFAWGYLNAIDIVTQTVNKDKQMIYHTIRDEVGKSMKLNIMSSDAPQAILPVRVQSAHLLRQRFFAIWPPLLELYRESTARKFYLTPPIHWINANTTSIR